MEPQEEIELLEDTIISMTKEIVELKQQINLYKNHQEARINYYVKSPQESYNSYYNQNEQQLAQQLAQQAAANSFPSGSQNNDALQQQS